MNQIIPLSGCCRWLQNCLSLETSIYYPVMLSYSHLRNVWPLWIVPNNRKLNALQGSYTTFAFSLRAIAVWSGFEDITISLLITFLLLLIESTMICFWTGCGTWDWGTPFCRGCPLWQPGSITVDRGEVTEPTDPHLWSTIHLNALASFLHEAAGWSNVRY